MKGYPMEKPAQSTWGRRWFYGYPMEKLAQSTWGRRWWKAIPWKNRLSPPEDAVDERLSHGKTGDVLTVLWKNGKCPQFCKCDISGSSLEPFNCKWQALGTGQSWSIYGYESSALLGQRENEMYSNLKHQLDVSFNLRDLFRERVGTLCQVCCFLVYEEQRFIQSELNEDAKSNCNEDVWWILTESKTGFHK